MQTVPTHIFKNTLRIHQNTAFQAKFFFVSGEGVYRLPRPFPLLTPVLAPTKPSVACIPSLYKLPWYKQTVGKIMNYSAELTSLRLKQLAVGAVTVLLRREFRPCWKALVEFLLSVIELLFLSLKVEALQGKMCQNSLPSGGGRSLGAKVSGGKGRPPADILIPLERQ